MSVLIVANEDGKPDFEAMMSRFQSKRSPYKVSYVVFDVLMLNGGLRLPYHF